MFDSWGANEQLQNDFTDACKTQNICLDCAAGKMGKGGTCKPCQKGLFQDQEGQTSCGGCAAGQYQNETGKNACKACPEGRYLSVTDGKDLLRKFNLFL